MREGIGVFNPYHIRGKITGVNANWLRQKPFFLNHESTFGSQEGMIT